MIDLKRQRLPKVYMRNNKECYLDFIREKLIYITPEETIRQKVISYLIDVLEVPKEVIAVEESLSHYGIKSSKRADIIIHAYDKENRMIPVVVIECKASDVFLGDRALNQMLDYCDALYCDYAMLINGNQEYCYKYDEDKNAYFEIEELPKYSEIVKGEYVFVEKEEIPERIPFEKHEEHLIDARKNFDGDYYFCDVSPQTPMEIAKPALNLCECLLDHRVKMPTGKYGMFELIEDYGVRMLDYGNASGGTFFGPYRSFLVNVDGSTEFVSFSITTYWKGKNTDNVKTCLAVAIDNEKTTHHSLQLVLDDNLVVEDNVCRFHHHGKIAIGNLGSGKVDELRKLVMEKHPEIISGNNFLLGTVINDKLWGLDDINIIKLIENLISYAILRDEYRDVVKKKKIGI